MLFQRFDSHEINTQNHRVCRRAADGMNYMEMWNVSTPHTMPTQEAVSEGPSETSMFPVNSLSSKHSSVQIHSQSPGPDDFS